MIKLLLFSLLLIISLPIGAMETASQSDARLASAQQPQMLSQRELYQHETKLENMNAALSDLTQSIRNYGQLKTANADLLYLVNQAQELKNRYDFLDQYLAHDQELLGGLRKLRKEYGPKIKELVAKALANYQNALVKNPGFFLVEIERLNIAPQQFDTPTALQERKNLVGMFITVYKSVENNENIDPIVRRELKDVLMEASIPTHPRFFTQEINALAQANTENFDLQERTEWMNRLSDYLKIYAEKVKNNPHLKIGVKQTIKEALTGAYESSTLN